MLEKYKLYKSRRRVTFHIGACSVIFLACAIISKELIISLVLGIFFLICLFLYLFYKQKMNIIEKSIIKKCINCNKDIIFKEEINYLLYGQNVSKDLFENEVTTEKKKVIAKKYICENCHLCFSIVEIYQSNNKGVFSLIKKEKLLIEDYVEKD